MQLCTVMALERLGQFVEELHELGGRLIGQIDGQTHERQVVGLEHGAQRFLRALGVRDLALRSARSLASFRR